MTMTGPAPLSRTAGFTLIELMVVISIIAILAALLIPAIGLARAAALEIQCLSNLRQIGMGITGYTQDHHGQYPPVADNWAGADSSATGSTYWHVRITPYLDRDFSGYDPSSEGGILWGCPTWQGRGDLSDWGYWTKTGYGMTPHLAASTRTGDLDRKLHSWMLINSSQVWRIWDEASVTRSSERILVGDSTDFHLVLQWDVYNPWVSDPALEFQTRNGEPAYASMDPERHRGRANYLFCDLHVAKLTPEAAARGMVALGEDE